MRSLKYLALSINYLKSWNDFAKHLRHKQGDLSLTQLINTLRVEEKHRSNLEIGKEKTPKVNVVENAN